MIAFQPLLEESGRDGDADTEQDDATERLARFADLGAQEPAKFQPGESHGDADRADDNRCSEQCDVISAQAKPTARLSMLSANPEMRSLPRP